MINRIMQPVITAVEDERIATHFIKFQTLSNSFKRSPA
jgi:hypothetical protein